MTKGQLAFDKKDIDAWLSRTPPRYSARILLISEDGTIRSSFRTVLADFEYELFVRETLPEALSLLESSSFDLVLYKADEFKSKLDCLRQIRALTTALLVIISDDKATREALETSGMEPAGFMPNSPNSAQILNIIDILLRVPV